MACNGKGASMDLDTLLQLRPEFAMEPHLYIIRHPDPSQKVFRVGASGTQLYKDTDLPYRSDQAQLTGLLGRCRLYTGFWTPLQGQIHASLQIKRQLVARGDQRVGTDFTGQAFNIDRGNQTLVLAREKELHEECDRRGLRWRSDKRNELFVPQRSVNELIAAMRTIVGERLYLYSSDTVVEDSAYRGGKPRRGAPVVVSTQARQVQDRVARVPTVLLRLSRQAVEELRSTDPRKFETLLNIIDLIRPQKKEPPPPPEPPKPVEPAVPEGIVKLSREMIRALRGQSDTISKAVAADYLARQLARGETFVDAPRRSARVAARG